MKSQERRIAALETLEDPPLVIVVVQTLEERPELPPGPRYLIVATGVPKAQAMLVTQPPSEVV